MSWTNVDLSNTPTGLEVIAAGDYTLQILAGAKFSDFDANRIDAAAAIVGGQENGKRLFFSYPDPAKQDWSPKVFKRLVEALGEDIQEGENPVTYLNRVAGLRFEGTVTQQEYQTQEGDKVKKAKLDIFKPRPARQ